MELIEASLAWTLWRCGAIEIDTEQGYELALHKRDPKAPRSPLRLNLRTPQNPKPGNLEESELNEIAGDFQRLLFMRAIYPQAIAGIPNAGSFLARPLAERLDIPLIEIDKETYTLHYSGVEDNAIVVLVDDVITQADTKITYLELLRENSFRVTDLIVVVDREQGGTERLNEHNCKVHPILKLKELLLFYRNAELLDRKDYATIYTSLWWQPNGEP